jgi:hypothetical protein
VPFMPPTPINSIQSIDVQYLNLTFTPETAWAPLTSSNNVSAVLSELLDFREEMSEDANFEISNRNSFRIQYFHRRYFEHVLDRSEWIDCRISLHGKTSAFASQMDNSDVVHIQAGRECNVRYQSLGASRYRRID